MQSILILRSYLVAALFMGALVSPVHANTVGFNSDQVLLIDGKKVFPISIARPPWPDQKTPTGKNAYKEFSEAGINFLRTGQRDWDDQAIKDEKKYEDGAARYGMHCVLYLGTLSAIKPGKTNDELMLKKVVTTFRHHPGLAAWKGVDEPEWGHFPLPPMMHTREIVRGLDTNHPIAIWQAPKGTIESMRRYNAAGDIGGTDIYPIGYPPGKVSIFSKTNTEISMVGDYTKRMVEVGEGKMPVWMILQICWSGVMKSGHTLRFPTFPEERFMTYQSIIDGARGLQYFGGYITNGMTLEDRKLGFNWRFWNRVLRPVIEEIGDKSPLYPALLEANSKLPVKVTGSGIEFCVREVGKDIYVLACERNQTTEQVTFSGLPVEAIGGPLMFEEPRTVTIKDGKFSDWFGPFEVHVYHFNR